MPIHRLFDIVYLLIERKTITAKELAKRFEVSSRTVYRDIETLCTAGIPIYTTRGRFGGISILDNFVLNKSTLTDKEQNQILIALQTMRAAGNLEVDEIAKRLGSLFNKGDFNWIEVDFSQWGSGEEQKKQFEILKNAIATHCVVSFCYYSAAGECSERKVEPFKLLFKEKAWYLHGFCLERNDWRTFKLCRITNMEATNEIFSFERPMPKKDVVSCDNWNDEETKIKLHFDKRLAYHVLDEFPVSSVEQQPDGSLIVETCLPKNMWAYGYMMSFGDALEVLEPESVRQNLKELLQNTLSIYQK